VQFPIKSEIQVFGPAPMPITRVKNRYNYCLNVKVDKRIDLQKLIKAALDRCKIPSMLRVKIDVDPY
jgi:primosomal protein N' (replication factor Y)